MNHLTVFLFAIESLIFLVLSVPVHEAGHLVCGLISGYHFSMFQVFSLIWTNQNNRIVCTRTKNSFIIGQCHMTPPENEKDFKFILYNLGGGLANLLCAVLFIYLLITCPRNHITISILCAGIWVNLLMAASNLIPFKFFLPNDGMNLIMASKSSSAKHGFYCSIKTNELLLRNIRPAEINPELMCIDADADMSNYMSVAPLLAQYSYYYDLKDYEKSIAAYEAIDLDALPGYYRCRININYLYHYIIHKPDYQKAKEIFTRPEMVRLYNLKINQVTKVKAAYEFFVNKDCEKGQKLLQDAKSMLLNQQIKGVLLAEMEDMLMLEEKMKVQLDSGFIDRQNDCIPQ